MIIDLLNQSKALGIAVFLLLSIEADSQVVSRADHLLERQHQEVSNYLSLKKALNDLERRFDVNIIFQSKLAKDIMVKTGHVQGEKIDRALKKLLVPHGLTFKKVGARDYVVKPAEEPGREIKKISRKSLSSTVEKTIRGRLMLPLESVKKKFYANRNRLQEQTVTGKVIDEFGQPLPGVNVLVKGTTTGTVTDIEGNYTLSVPSDNTILIYSFVGYITEEVVVGNQSIINLTMTPDITTLGEVVVVAYGEAKRAELIGSVATVEAKTLDKQPVTTFEEALAGQIAGVNVRANTSVPGGAPEIQIRGINSISSGTAPLFVIDGYIYGNSNNQLTNPLAGIPPGDIESITVLKDAASASLYGAQASSGVVIITTKSGKEGATRVSFDSYVGIQSIPGRMKPNVLNARELAQFNREKWMDRYFADNGVFPTEDILDENNVIDPANFDEGTDWFDEITRDGLMQSHTISASGGSERSSYFISANYFDQQGVVTETGFTRYSLRANIDAKLNDKFKLGVRMSPSQAVFRRNGGTDPQSDAFSVDGTVFTSFWLGPDVRVRNFNGDLVPFEESQLINRVQNNPLWEQEVRESTLTTNQFNANTFIEYEPIEGLVFRPSFGLGIIATRIAGFRPEMIGGGIPNNLNARAPSQASFQYTENFRWQSENTITYNKTFADRHDLEVLGGLTLQSAEGFGQETVTQNLLEPFKLPNSDNVERFIGDTDNPNFNNVRTFPNDAGSKLISFLARVKYDYEDTYIFSAAIRRDGSSRFGRRVRYANFPSVAGGWRISNENFFKSLGIDNVVNNVLIEASYGELGNNRIGDFRWLGGVRLGGNGYVLGNRFAQGRAAGVDDLPNADLTWETTEEIAAGIDIGLFQNRVILQADYFRRDIFDLLNNETIPLVTGFDRVFGNIGDLRAEGLELSLSTVNFERNKFRWTTDFNITFNEVIVTRLGEDDTPINRESVNGGDNFLFELRVGDRLGLFYGLQYEGLYTEDDFDDNGDLLPDVPGYFGGGGAPTVGSAKFTDVNGNGGTDRVGDEVVIGDANPDFTYGISNYLSYGPWSLKVIMAGAVGQQIYDRTFELLNNFDPIGGREDISEFNMHRNVLDRWRPGDDPRTKAVPGTAGGDRPWRWANSAHVKDAGYLSVRNITLSYDFSNSLKESLPFLKNGTVYFSVQNAFIFSPFEGNPEVGRANAGALRPNVNFGSYPLARIFTGGLQVTF